MSGLVRYPYPLRPGRLVYLDLPSDLTMADVEKIARYITTLVVPQSPSVGEPSGVDAGRLDSERKAKEQNSVSAAQGTTAAASSRQAHKEDDGKAR